MVEEFELPFRTKYSGQIHFLTHTPGPEMTKQSFKDACDINRIMSRFLKTGTLPQSRAVGTYENLPDALDYHQAMNLVVQSDQAFAKMPSAIRSKFHNEPGELLAFLQDPDNRDEAVKLGLINPPAKTQETAQAPPLASAATEPAATGSKAS